MLVVELVGVILRTRRADADLSGPGCVDVRCIDVRASRVAGQVFDVEGRRLALRADISDWSGSLLVHHLHALALAGLEALLVVRAGAGRHRGCDLAYGRRTADHFKVTRGLANRV